MSQVRVRQADISRAVKATIHSVKYVTVVRKNSGPKAAVTWPEPLTFAVNLSPAQFEAGSVSTIVASALKATGLAPHRLEFEITETLLLGNSGAIMKELQAIKAMGVAIVMDDFGTGYSSLSYLWRLPHSMRTMPQPMTLWLAPLTTPFIWNGS